MEDDVNMIDEIMKWGQDDLIHRLQDVAKKAGLEEELAYLLRRAYENSNQEGSGSDDSGAQSQGSS
jgi:hypothetical protein